MWPARSSIPRASTAIDALREAQVTVIDDNGLPQVGV
jgi:hypothetical protein